MSEGSTWHPTCPSCGKLTPTAEAEASRRRDAISDLEGRQATCSACGTTFTVDRRTVVRKV